MRTPLTKYLLIVFLALTTLITFIYSIKIRKPQSILPGLAALLGDCDNNETVDIIDFQLLSNSFGKTSVQSGYNAGCDFNVDKVVDILDFQILSNNFGKSPSGFDPSIWWADADSNGMSAWQNLQCPTGDGGIIDDPLGIYGKVYRATLNPGDIYSGDGKSRCEYYGSKLSTGKVLNYFDGDDYYFGWRSMVSNGVYTNNGNSGNFIQLKGDSSCGGPAVGLTMENGNLTLRSELYGIFWNGPKMTSFTGTWHDIVLHVHFSKNSSIGFVESWLDGVSQNFIDGTKRYHIATMCPNDSYIYLKMGYYRGSNTEFPSATHWFESPRIGKSYSSVVPR